MNDRVRDIRVRDRRKRGWFSIDNEIVDDYGPSIGPMGLALYAVLCRRASSEDSAIVRQSNLAYTSGMSQSSVRRSLRTLEAHGLIEVIHRFDEANPKIQYASEYVLLEPNRAPSTAATAPRDSGGTLPTQVPVMGRSEGVPRSEDLRSSTERNGTLNGVTEPASKDSGSSLATPGHTDRTSRQWEGMGPVSGNGAPVSVTDLEKDSFEKQTVIKKTGRLTTVEAGALMDRIRGYGPELAVLYGRVTAEEVEQVRKSSFRKELEELEERHRTRWLPH